MSDAYNEIPNGNNSSDINWIDTELQVRLMNLVMGEASDFERDQLQLLMEQRPELAAFCKHLEHLHGLLSDVGAGEPAIDIDSATADAEWRLPADRRERVLAVLENRIVNPPPKVRLANKRSLRNWRITTMEAIVVASIACVILGLMLPATQFAREAASRLSSQSELTYRTKYMAPLAAPAKGQSAGRSLNTIVSASDAAAPSAVTTDFYSHPSSFEENGTNEIAPSSNGIAVDGQALPSPKNRETDGETQLGESKVSTETTVVPAKPNLEWENGLWVVNSNTNGSLDAVEGRVNTLGGINRLFKNDVSDHSTLMMTVTPKIIIPEVEQVTLGVGASASSPETSSRDRVELKKDGKPSAPKQPVTLDEQSASADAFSTFSLHVSDVSFKLAQAALSQSQWPEAAKIRIEEFVNALDYHDPLPSGDQKIACRVEQAIHPFLMQRNLLRVSMRTAAAGRSQNTPLRLTLLLDNSGSMERPDRRQAVLRAFQTLTQQLKATDQITLISFASSPRLLADKVSGNQGEMLLKLIETLPSEGGTNIESALQLAREKAVEQQVAGAQNRIVLLTDGAVNLGDADPENLAKQVTQMRDAGIAFDAAGISAQDLNDEVLEALTRKGDGRYYLLDSAELASDSFAAQIAGSLRPSAQNVKVQLEFNPQRVGRYKLLGYEKHRLNKEDFRNDQVDAAEMAAAEAGVAVYQYEIKPQGNGDVGSVSVRFRDLATGQMVERRWPILYESNTPRLEQSQPSMQLAAAAALFAAKLGGGPLAESVDMAQLQKTVAKLPEQFAGQPRVQQLRAMIEQAIAIH
ncbi:MAG: von Willebrand factor type A domain-containing protein [Planctomycetota bacterium]|nr:von Willebrand factor type A domain-containing protein [Planctomycetota bacterium]